MYIIAVVKMVTTANYWLDALFQAPSHLYYFSHSLAKNKL